MEPAHTPEHHPGALLPPGSASTEPSADSPPRRWLQDATGPKSRGHFPCHAGFAATCGAKDVNEFVQALRAVFLFTGACSRRRELAGAPSPPPAPSVFMTFYCYKPVGAQGTPGCSRLPQSLWERRTRRRNLLLRLVIGNTVIEVPPPPQGSSRPGGFVCEGGAKTYKLEKKLCVCIIICVLHVYAIYYIHVMC